MLGNTEDARDVAQLTFLRVWENLPALRPDLCLLDLGLSHRRQPRHRRPGPRNPGADAGGSPGRGRTLRPPSREAPLRLSRREIRRLRRLLDGPFPKQKIVFVLRELEEESREVAEIVGCRSRP
ncbi:MAG: hypothetical protein IPN83_00005 [Holophagales bacterium]|nr:hypothetical protein [Holophagales bacterium]